MSAEDFPHALAFTLVEEGGNDDDPHDHGGRTSRGITQREWDAWRAAHPGNTWPTDVWEAPQDQIEAIYHDQYYEPYCDKLPAGIDLAFFDFSVNAGRGQAVKSLQRALGVEADGMMGVITLGAVAQANDATLIHVYADRRRAFYRSLAQFPRYGKDWIGRTDRCEAAAQKLAPRGTVAAPSAKPSPRANPADKAQPPVKPPTGVVVSGGSGGLAGILHQLQDMLAPYAGVVHGIEYALVAIAVAGFVITLYGFWHQQQTAALAG